MIIKLLLISALFAGLSISEPDVELILQEGFELEEQDQYEEAVLHWLDHFYLLDEPSPAIAREIVRLSAASKLRDYYEIASMVYLEGLESTHFESTAERLLHEITMLSPLMSNSDFRELSGLVENEDPEIYTRLLNFWNRMDPTPGSEHNARLIEHWERIAHIKEHYTRSRGRLGTDDRGEIYLKYGEPDRTFSGRFTVTRGQVYSLSQTLDPGADQQFMANVIMTIGLEPDYEIWVYDRPNQVMNDNLIKIFGDRPNGGFGNLETIDQFIPNHLFTFDSNRYSMRSLTGNRTQAGVNITPGMVYQWLFYEQLASSDPFFGRQFSGMVQEWESAETAMGRVYNPTSGRHAGHQQQQRSQASTLQNISLAPEQISTYQRRLPEINLNATPYRILNEQNEPAFALFIESESSQAFIEDFAYNEQRMYDTENEDPQRAFNNYRLFHAFQLQSSTQEVMAHQRQETDLIIDFEEGESSRSVFVVPAQSDNVSYRVAAELHNQHPETSLRFESTLEPTLRGLGQVEFQQPDPLTSIEGELQVSDLFLGYQLRGDLSGESYLPFVVASDRRIPQNEDLVVRFEAYHLQQNSDGIASFQLDYRLLPQRSSLFSGRQQDDFSLSLTFETDSERFTENVEIETGELDAGSYHLEMVFTDLRNDKSVTRDLEFNIHESKPGKDE